VRSRSSAVAASLTAACLIGGSAHLAAAPPTGADPPGLGERAAEILSHAIRLNTVNPPGHERPLAEYFVRLLREAGLEAALIETPSGESRAGRAAAWARLRGSGARRPLVLLSHLDVVPADPRAWEVDPFAGIQKDGFVIGRGALDAKGVAVVHLMAMTELLRRGIRLERDLLFLATPDEENGGLEGAGYLAREHSDLLQDAEYLLTEGGGVSLGKSDSRPVWGVAVIEKSPCWMRVVARGTPGHSSAPPRDAAVPRLVAALERVRRLEHPTRVVPEVTRMFATLAPLAAPEDAAGYADLASALATDPAFRGRFLADRAHRALVRNTLTITVLKGSSSTNVVPREAVAHLDARLLTFERCEAFATRIRRAIADPGVDPGAVVVPRMLSGFTDAHFFRELGITAYGFVPRWHQAGALRGIHGPEERISVENLERGANTLIQILQELDRLE
jgi:acetylornithine deacetylase/succinyl-diaminopimelate desuccinylase-like protein